MNGGKCVLVVCERKFERNREKHGCGYAEASCELATECGREQLERSMMIMFLIFDSFFRQLKISNSTQTKLKLKLKPNHSRSSANSNF